MKIVFELKEEISQEYILSITTSIPSINWPDYKIWRTIPPLNVAESNWASVVGLVPTIELKVFMTPQ